MSAHPASDPFMSSPAGSGRVLQGVVREAIAVEPRSTVAWAALREARDRLRIRAVGGARTDAVAGLRIGVGQGLSGRVFHRGAAHWVDDYRASASITHEFDAIITGEHLRRMAAAPIAVDGDVVGVFVIGSRDDGRFGTRALTAVHRLAADAATTLSSTAPDPLVDPREQSDRVLRRLSSGALALREVRAGIEAVDAGGGVDAPVGLTQIAESLRAVEASLRALLGDVVEERALPEPVPALTPRQQQVLELVAEGLTTRAIADRLHLSPETVKGYVKQALIRLGARTRAEGIAAWRSPWRG